MYFSFSGGSTSRLPHWMFSDKLEMTVVGGTGWQHVPSRMLHPVHVPEDLRSNHTVVLMKSGDNEPLLHSAIKSGTFLTLGQLHQIRGQVPFPLPGQGRGKGGRVVKHDVAEALVAYLFPTASQQEQFKMVVGIMGRQWRHLQPSKSSPNCSDILKAFQALDPEDKSEYSQLAAMAEDELVLKEKRDSKPRAVESTPGKKQHETPAKLQDLVPARGRVSRHPLMKRYQVFYPEFDKGGSLVQVNGSALKRFSSFRIQFNNLAVIRHCHYCIIMNRT